MPSPPCRRRWRATRRPTAGALAAEWGLRWTPVVTHEMERAAYRMNDTDRCFHCKAELMDVVGPIAAAEEATVVLGVNLDDLGEHRPGQKAAVRRRRRVPAGDRRVHQGRHPRARRQRLGLRTWDKPAMACLASRVPYGTEVSVGLLTQLDRAEAALRRLGFRQLRVRHYDDTARLEVPVDDLACRARPTRGRRGGRSGAGLPLRHARSRGLPIRKPQRLANRVRP